jgi:P-type Cu+ transporter
MDKDPVCGMIVSRTDVAGDSEYQGKTYYFCSPSCKERFDADPARFALQSLEDRSEIE